jgi:hypothetical protein
MDEIGILVIMKGLGVNPPVLLLDSGVGKAGGVVIGQGLVRGIRAMQDQASISGLGLKYDGELKTGLVQIIAEIEVIVFRSLVLGDNFEQIRDQHQLFVEQPIDFVAAAPPEKGGDEAAYE